MATRRASVSEALDHESLGLLAQDIKPQPLSAERKSAMRARLFERIRNVDSPAPPGTETIRAEAMEWRALTPLIDIKVLYRDPREKTETILLRVRPGGTIPRHHHRITEECWVLEGEAEVDGHILGQGDMHIAHKGYQHPALSSRTGALLLVRCEIREQALPG